MDKFKTKANKAEEHIHELLNDSHNIYRPWSLVDKKLENRTLDCTAEEASIIYKNNSMVRPGYEVSRDKVFVPTLFVKFSGKGAASAYFKKKSDLKAQPRTFLYENFKGFCDTKQSNDDVSSFITPSGVLLINDLISCSDFPYSYLRREYQVLLVEKIDYYLKNRDSFFVSKTSDLNDIELLNILLNLDSNLIGSFNEFDFQQKPPALIFRNRSKVKLTRRQAVSLMMFSLLGFDIIVICDKGFADIENHYDKNIYSIFYGEKIPGKPLLKPLHKGLITVSATVLAAVVLISTLGTSNKPIEPGEVIPPPQQNVIIPDNDNTDNGTVDTDTSSSDNLVPDNPTVVIPDDSLQSDGITVTYDNDDNCVDSIINFSIIDPEGNPMDMSKVTYTFNRNSTTISRDLFWGHDPSWLEEDVFTTSYNKDIIQIFSSEDGWDFHYIFAADFEDYCFLFQGTISKEEYINHRRMNISFDLRQINSSEVSATFYKDIKASINYSFTAGHYFNIRDISEDYNKSCRGEFNTLTGKTFYSNLPSINIEAYYTRYDGIVFYSTSNISLAANKVVIHMNPAEHGLGITKTLYVNPDLTDFPYYYAHFTTDGMGLSITDRIPSDNKITIRSNTGAPPPTTISIGKDPNDEHVSGVGRVRLNNNNTFGYNVSIFELSAYKAEGTAYDLMCFFRDGNNNKFQYMGYNHDEQLPGLYDFKLVISQNGKTLFEDKLSPYYATLDISLPDGEYDVAISPVYENTLYSGTTNFTLLVQNDLLEPLNFHLNED